MNRRILFVGAVAAFVAVLGANLASAQGGAAYYACVNNSSGTLKMVSADVQCEKNWTKIDWDKSGPPGPAGPQGEPGPQGPEGPNGPAGGSVAPACWDNDNRYVDCGNGTVNDTMTGLLWLKDANCFGALDYASANVAAAGLADGACGLSDNSAAGDWRLPTEIEWQATMGPAAALSCYTGNDPSVTNTLGTACYKAGPRQFTNVQTGDYWSGIYWSATTLADYPMLAMGANMYHGFMEGYPKSEPFYMWPVRAGD